MTSVRMTEASRLAAAIRARFPALKLETMELPQTFEQSIAVAQVEPIRVDAIVSDERLHVETPERIVLSIIERAQEQALDGFGLRPEMERREAEARDEVWRQVKLDLESVRVQLDTTTADSSLTAEQVRGMYDRALTGLRVAWDSRAR